MKTLLILLIPLLIFGCPSPKETPVYKSHSLIAEQDSVKSVEVRANLKLADGSVIMNAPSGKDWTAYDVIGIDLFEVISYSKPVIERDTIYISRIDTVKILDTIFLQPKIFINADSITYSVGD
jgi:hypothetical protein